jgi:hypothetical protein
MLWRARDRPPRPVVVREALVFGGIFAILTAGGAAANARHLRGQFEGYAGRVDRAAASLVATAPAAAGDQIFFTRMAAGGAVLDRTGGESPLLISAQPGEDLFFPTVTPLQRDGWIELASRGGSRVVRFARDARDLAPAALPVEIDDAEQPVASADARWLAFLRQDRGRGVLHLFDRRAGRQREVAAAPRSVLEAGFFPDDRVVVAAFSDGRARLFAGDAASAHFDPLETSDRPARFPAVSPDGAWLAYSEEEHGQWQLYVLSLATGQRRRLTDADCNATRPAWLSGSRRLVYACDCARGQGLTALCTIAAVP